MFDFIFTFYLRIKVLIGIRPSGMLVSSNYGMDIHIKGYITLVLMHSGIVNGYQLLCDAHTVLEPHRGTAAFSFFAHYRPFPLFLFMCLSL